MKQRSIGKVFVLLFAVLGLCAALLGLGGSAAGDIYVNGGDVLTGGIASAYAVTGAAVALVAGNAVMFLYRTVTGQYYYRTIPSIPRTVSGFLLAVAATAAGVVFYQHFLLKFLAVGAILFVYCTLYRPQLQKLWQLGLGLLRKLTGRRG